MSKSRVLSWTLLAVSVLALLSIAERGEACMAITLPDVRVMKLEPVAEGPGTAQRLRYVAFFSEYNCAPMPPKTFCALGLCLRPDPGLRKVNIQVHSMRFVEQEKGEPLPGFDPKPNRLTASSFQQRKGGVWFGFASLFQRQFDRQGGVELKVEFSAAPGTSDETIKKILSEAYVGAAGGNKDGRVVDGHHLEIVKVSKVTMMGQERQTAAR